MVTLTVIILIIQVATFLALGGVFMATGHMRLWIAQILLAAVQVVIYSEGITR